MGGSMGVTQGMLAEFGAERVRNTPISEMAIVGAGIGAAMQGMRPIVEIMYEDFTTLAMEQLVNQAAKHRYMSGGQLQVPLTVRTQGGAGWSPGAQHAQQVEAWFVHVPGLKVVFASTPSDVRGLLWSSIYDDNTVIFFEHRTLYPIKEEVSEELEPIPLGKARIHREGEDVTVIATGRLVHESLAAAIEAEKEGISVEVVDPRTLQPLDEEALVGSVKKTNRCVVAHEAVVRGGLRRRGRRGDPVPGVRLARRADRACRVEVHADPVRAGDGELRRAARRPTCSTRSAGRWGAVAERGHAAPARPGDGVRNDRPLAEGRGRRGRRRASRCTSSTPTRSRRRSRPTSAGVLLKILVAEGEVPVGRAVGVIGRPRASLFRRSRPRRRPRRQPRRSRAAPEPEPEAPTRSPCAVRDATAVGSRRRRSPAGSRASAASTSPRWTAPAPRGGSSPRTSSGRGAPSARPAPARAASPAGAVERVELTSLRRTIARRMTEAWTAPAFQISMSADMTRAQELRARLRRAAPRRAPDRHRRPDQGLRGRAHAPPRGERAVRRRRDRAAPVGERRHRRRD